MTFYELYKALDSRFPIELRCDWDNDGIMCADDLEKPVKRVLVSLDVTMDTVKYAIDNKFDTIVSHHPLVFHSQNAINPLNYTQKKLIDLIKNGIRVMSFHTRLDASDGGVNDVMAELIGFEFIEKDVADPVGRIGTLQNEIQISTFAEMVKEILGAPCAFYTGNKPVKKVYMVGGAGSDYVSYAINLGADTLLTGNVGYNTMIDAQDMGINIIQAGHFYTEAPVCHFLKRLIKEIDNSIQIEYFSSNRIKMI